MKKIFGKISALISSLMLTAAMSCTALASGSVDAGSDPMKRYLLLGGIVLAIGILFYIFLAIKTKKKK